MAQVKCKYIFEDDYNPIYINGAHGGIGSQGEVVVSFYLERPAIPVIETFEVKDNNTMQQVKTEPSDYNESVVRYVKNGIVMNYGTAKAIHKWLGDNISKLEEINSTKTTK